MKPEIVTGWTAVFAVLVAAGPLLAHHSAGVFETTAPIRLKGAVVRFAWANPHSAESGEDESRSRLLEGADRVITARLLVTQHGPEVHWSHCGP